MQQAEAAAGVNAEDGAQKGGVVEVTNIHLPQQTGQKSSRSIKSPNLEKTVMQGACKL